MTTSRAHAAAAAALALLLLAAVTAAEVPQPGGGRKRSFGFRVQSRDGAAHTFRRSLLRNATIPLHGAVKDYGYFYATLYLGTPAKKFAVIVDTGSTMTYVPCTTCGAGCGPHHQDAAFDPEASTTAHLISCISPKCTCGSPRCGCSAQQCTYTRSYAEQSSSSGILLEDVLALHDGQPGAPIIFGCETRETGEIYKQRADGLFGLGNSDASVVNQLVKAGVIDDVFSLCFGMVEGDGALLLGDAEVPGNIQLQYTPLLTLASHPFYYNVKMLSLAVDGSLLPVSQALFDQGYGTVLDSGTTFTYVPTSVFQAFASAVERFAVGKGLKRVPGPDPQYKDICFGQAPVHEDLEGLSAVFPSMEVQFDQGTSLVLGPLNYLFVHTFNSGKYCLGVFDNGRAGTLLGGITFRNVLVRYDRANRRIGFGPAPCKVLGEMQRPPCSYFAQGGSGELTSAAAAADGDCSMEPMRQQQQETGEADDTPAQPQPVAADAAQQHQQAAQQEAKPAGTQAGTRTWHPPETQQGGQQGAAQQEQAAAAQQAGDAAPEQHPAAQQQQQQGVPRDSAHAGEASQEQAQQSEHSGINRGSASSTSGKATKGSAGSVLLGMLVAAASVLSLVLAVALLQPATRDRIRSAFGSRQYRVLDEEQDPEGGSFTPTAAAAEASTGGGGGGGGSAHAGEARALELASTSNGPQLKPIELSGVRGDKPADGLRPPRGLTTPTKLQRSASNVEAETLAAQGGPTPRAGAGSAQSPLR